ncbi:MAG: hypothetical protein ACOCR0_02980 [Haloferacaceae archaeon]
MEDPLPENIDGEKRVVHSIEHSVNWSHVAIALVVLYLLVAVGPSLLDGAGSASCDDEGEW